MRFWKSLLLLMASAMLVSAAVSCEKISPDPDPAPVNGDGGSGNSGGNGSGNGSGNSGSNGNGGSGSTTPQTTELKYPAPANKAFRRIAYFPSYRSVGESYVPDFIYQSIDIACYAFASINASFGVDVASPEVLKALVARAHKMGVKVVISFNGTSSRFVTMTGTAAGREIFVKAVMDVVDKYNLDGVDNDWEYPSTKNGSDKGNLELMKMFSNRLHDPAVNKLLTMAITPGIYAGSYRDAILDALFDCVDWFNVMHYDDFSTTVAGKNHASFDMVKKSYDYFVTQRKMPPSKFLVGLPCYGRPSGITQSGTTMSYSGILKQGGDPDADSATVTSSSYSGGAYTIYYNGRPTIRSKVAFAREKGLGGYFFWEQGQDSYDDKSLIKAAAEAAAEK